MEPYHRHRHLLLPAIYHPGFDFFFFNLSLLLGLSWEWSLHGVPATVPHGEARGELRRPLPGLASGDCGWSLEVLRGGGGLGQCLLRCQEGARRPQGWGPRLACGWLGGKGLQVCKQKGSIRREQVAAFRTLGEHSPPSVTPYPLLSTPPCPQEVQSSVESPLVRVG